MFGASGRQGAENVGGMGCFVQSRDTPVLQGGVVLGSMAHAGTCSAGTACWGAVCAAGGTALRAALPQQSRAAVELGPLERAVLLLAVLAPRWRSAPGDGSVQSKGF